MWRLCRILCRKDSIAQRSGGSLHTALQPVVARRHPDRATQVVLRARVESGTPPDPTPLTHTRYLAGYPGRLATIATSEATTLLQVGRDLDPVRRDPPPLVARGGVVVVPRSLLTLDWEGVSESRGVSSVGRRPPPAAARAGCRVDEGVADYRSMRQNASTLTDTTEDVVPDAVRLSACGPWGAAAAHARGLREPFARAFWTGSSGSVASVSWAGWSRTRRHVAAPCARGSGTVRQRRHCARPAAPSSVRPQALGLSGAAAAWTRRFHARRCCQRRRRQRLRSVSHCRHRRRLRAPTVGQSRSHCLRHPSRSLLTARTGHR